MMMNDDDAYGGGDRRFTIIIRVYHSTLSLPNARAMPLP